MVNYLVERIIEFQKKYEIINDEEKDIYQVGYELLISKSLSILMMIIIGIIQNNLVIVLGFTCIFASLRQYSGGYHFNTAEKCILFSVLLCVLGLPLMEFLMKKSNGNLLLLIEFCSIAIIWKCSPIPSKNKGLSANEIIKYGKYTKILLIVEGGIYLLTIDSKYFFIWCSMEMAHIVIAISQLLEYTKQKSMCKYYR